MDLSGAFEYGQGYVALSRVRTLKGLSLAGLNERALEVHPEIQKKDAEMRAASEAARKAFAAMPQDELEQMQNNFIKASGGAVEAKKKNSGAGSERLVEEGKGARLAKIRETHPNAYMPWSKEEDERLKEDFLSGKPQKDLVDSFGRQKGSIRARLIKLGLIEE